MGLENILDVLGESPLAKWLAAAFALRALWTLVVWRRCGLLRGAVDAASPDVGAALARRQDSFWRKDLRFLGIMVGGLTLAIVGLFGLAKSGMDAPLALVMLVAGLYLFMTEPVRLQIANAEVRLATAARSGDAEGEAMARAMLGGNHVNLVLIDVAAAGALGLAVLALSGGMAMPG